jgi:hypothetical protein
LDNGPRVESEFVQTVGVIPAEGDGIKLIDGWCRWRWYGLRLMRVLVIKAAVSDWLRVLGIRWVPIAALRRIERHW